MKVGRLLLPLPAPPVGSGGSRGISRRCVSFPFSVGRTSVSARWEAGDAGGNRMFVFGTGFVGRHVADRLIREEGWQVSGTCTSANKKIKLEELGLETFIFDASKSKFTSLPTLPHATHLLISIPPVVGLGDPLLSLHEDLRKTLRSGSLRWLCYLSSTSVYGDCGGALVDEDYAVNPKTESAKTRFATEKGWLDLGQELGIPVIVLRLGGIYGPGRSALDTIVKGKLLSESQKKRKSRLYTARVHVADIYQAINASFTVSVAGRIYNVVDDDPAPREEVFAFAENLIKQKWPDTECISGWSNNGGDSPQGDKHDEKRVSNARIKKELGMRLLYPSYKLGLQNILETLEPNIEQSY